jgi:two-component system cell cycle sensor histidine kinase/response regulator CckA
MSPVRILVVEDEGAVGRDIQNTLVRCGYSVADIARTGSEALEIVRRVDPDLVIMDIRLSGSMDGIEAAERIRSLYGKPIIYLTALADEDTMARASRTEPEGYLLKPFNESELQSTVEIAISRSRSRKALADREEQFMSTLRSMADGVIATDIVGNVTFMNPVAESITGWGFAEARSKVLQEVFAISDDAGRKAPPLAPRPRPSGRHLGRRVMLLTKDGRRVQVEDNSAPLKDSHGSLVGLVVVFRRCESAGDWRSDTNEGESLRGIVEGIADPIVAFDRHWKITFANHRAAKQFGRSQDGLIGSAFWELLPEGVREENFHDTSRALARKERCSFEFYQDSSRRWFEANIYPFGEGLLVLMRDVTERIEQQETASRIEKLECLGLLARGFAHDFNNILTVMLGNLSLAEMKLPEGIAGRIELEQARAATLRAQNRVHQLLTFAKGGAPIRQRMDLQRAMTEVEEDMERNPRIEYRFKIAADLWQIDADSGQLRRVIENLLRNSEEAMVRGGRLTVRFENAPSGSVLRENLPASMELEDGADYVVLQVKDNGHGIDEDLLDKIFEPYFSTRGDANATGIGLTVCDSIVRAHNGGICCQSIKGEGTKVVVAFPAPVDRSPDTFHPDTKPAGNTARFTRPRILVLEDEPLIRQLLVANLEQEGFEVVETEDGVETAARYIESYDRGDPFDLVIADLSIPNGVGGAKAIEEIMQIDPGVKAIVSSGYSDDPVMAEPGTFGFSGVLPKPYQPKQLLSLVQRILAI